MSDRRHHDCHDRHDRRHDRHHHDSSSYGNGAPTYNFDPMQQGPGPYGQQMAPAYGQQAAYGGYGAQGGYGPQVMPYQQSGYGGQDLQSLQAEEHRHRKNEHLAEAGALGAVAFAAYEKHEETVDPEHEHRHHVEMQAGEAAAVGLGGYAVYEHHEASKIYKQESEFGGDDRHGRHQRRHGR